jgi:hypothetical protein
MKQRKQLVRGLILAFVVAALALPPVAQGKPISSRQSRPNSITIRHADDRAGIRGVGSAQAPQVVSGIGTGFDWKDASLGAGAALVALLILTSGIAISRRERGPVAA